MPEKNLRHKKAAPRRVYLHVGLPSTDSTLTASLARHADALLELGLRYPDGGAEMRRAALDVIGQDAAWGEDPDAVRGAFTRIATKRPGRKLDLLISHELLAGASVGQASYALSMLTNAEVHLVVVARDAGRQVLDDWQAMRPGAPKGPPDLVAVLERWGAGLPPERVHVVVAPPDDADAARLWRLFGESVGRDVSALKVVGGQRPRLDTTGLALLRRVSAALGERGAEPAWGRVAGERYVGEVALRAAGPAALPSSDRDRLTDLAERWAKEIDAAGYVVHGDPAHLFPVLPPAGSPHPDDLLAGRVLDLAVGTSADLLAALAGQQQRIADLEADVARLQDKRDKLKRRLRRAGR